MLFNILEFSGNVLEFLGSLMLFMNKKLSYYTTDGALRVTVNSFTNIREFSGTVMEIVFGNLMLFLNKVLLLQRWRITS